MTLNEIIVAARESKLSDNENELRFMLDWCVRYHNNNRNDLQASFAIEAIQRKMELIKADKRHQESIAEQQRIHQQATEQGSSLHGETMGEMVKLKSSVDLIKSSVDRLARTLRIEWWILAAGWIAAIASVAAVALELFLRR